MRNIPIFVDFIDSIKNYLNHKIKNSTNICHHIHICNDYISKQINEFMHQRKYDFSSKHEKLVFRNVNEFTGYCNLQELPPVLNVYDVNKH